MKILVRGYWLTVFCMLCLPTFAQLQITSPVSRMVFQRNLRNEATIQIAGLAPSGSTLIEARFVPLITGQGTVTAWTSLTMLAGSTAFRGFVTASAGWYRLDVRARSNTTQLDVASVNRVGVGEVFITAGQSNAYGGFQRVPGAVDDRVSCIDFRQDSLSEQLLPLQFSHISYGTSIGPSQPPHIWGLLGDKLVQRLNVPVLFLGAALGGTTSDQWRQSAAGNIGKTPNSAVYRQLGAVLLHYVRRTGARAVLWHQGEGDISTNSQTYFDNIRYVIEKSRQQLGSNPLPWVVSRVSYISNQTNPSVISAQNRLISDVPAVFAGPATDNLTGTDNRPDGVHFGGNGFYRFTDLWEQSLTSDFFQMAVPFTPADTLALITNGYTLPLTRRPGETLAVASLRGGPVEADNQHVAQLIRASDGMVVFESARSIDNPVLITLPASLSDGSYQLRTQSTHPVIAGTLSEPFFVQRSASSQALLPVLRQPVRGGSADLSVRRFGYRYESESHSFFALLQSDTPLEVRLQRIDGGSFNDSGWASATPASQAPDYTDFADFNYLRNYPPVSNGVGGVDPGRYRLSVRPRGDSGAGLWYEMLLLNGRNILYYPMEPVTDVPPILAVTNTVPCLSESFSVSVAVTEGSVNASNVYSVRLSAPDGSFANETTLASSTTSPISVTLPATLPNSDNYRLRVVASNPAIASAPSPSLSLCASSGSADLSLDMHPSTRIPSVNQPVTITLVINNAGTYSASDVLVKSILPNGLRFIDAVSSNVSALSGTVSIRLTKLVAGASEPFIFRVQPGRAGSFVTAAQITASAQKDPDSQPNSGTGDGQDDAAQIDLRTVEASDSLTVSSNLNQTPLPGVQSNQPLTSPSKADLSLSMTTPSLLITPGNVFSLTLTVSNLGGADASNVTIQTLLPTGWQITNTSSLTVSAQTVSGTLSTIARNGSASLVLTIRPTGNGILNAQVFSATPTDPDSTPGNGYANGEDDEATLTLRVR